MKNFYNQGQVNTLFLLAVQNERVNILHELLKQFPEYDLSETYAQSQHIWNHLLKNSQSPWKLRRYEYRQLPGLSEDINHLQDMFQRVITSLGNPWTTIPFEDSALPEIIKKDELRIQNILNNKSSTEPEHLVPIVIKESPPYLALYACGSKETDELALQFLNFKEAKHTLDEWYKKYGIHPISAAVENDSVELVQKYLNIGVSPNLLVGEEHYGDHIKKTSLLAFAKSEAMVKTLLDAGALLKDFTYRNQPQDLLDFWKSKSSSISSSLPKMLNVVLEQTPNPDAPIDAFIINAERLNITEFKRFYKTQNKALPLQPRIQRKKDTPDSAYSYFIKDNNKDSKTNLGIARHIIEQNPDKLHETTSLGESWITHTLRLIKPRNNSNYQRDYPPFAKFGEALQKTSSWKLVFPENLYIPGAQPEQQTVQNVAKIMKQLMTDEIAQCFYSPMRRLGATSWLDDTFSFSQQTLNTILPEQNITLKEHIYATYRDYYATQQPTPISNPYVLFGGILHQKILNQPLKEIMSNYLAHPIYNLSHVVSNANQLLNSEQDKFNCLIQDDKWSEQVLNQYTPLEKEIALIQLIGTMPENFNLFNRNHDQISPAAGLAAALLNHGTKHYIKPEDVNVINKSINSEITKKLIDKAFLNNKIKFNNIPKAPTQYSAL